MLTLSKLDTFGTATMTIVSAPLSDLRSIESQLKGVQKGRYQL